MHQAKAHPLENVITLGLLVFQPGTEEHPSFALLASIGHIFTTGGVVFSSSS